MKTETEAINTYALRARKGVVIAAFLEKNPLLTLQDTASIWSHSLQYISQVQLHNPGLRERRAVKRQAYLDGLRSKLFSFNAEGARESKKNKTILAKEEKRNVEN